MKFSARYTQVLSFGDLEGFRGCVRLISREYGSESTDPPSLGFSCGLFRATLRSPQVEGSVGLTQPGGHHLSRLSLCWFCATRRVATCRGLSWFDATQRVTTCRDFTPLDSHNPCGLTPVVRLSWFDVTQKVTTCRDFHTVGFTPENRVTCRVAQQKLRLSSR